MPDNTFEVHDASILKKARTILDNCKTGIEMQQAVLEAVKRNEIWRGRQCVNLLAPEAPTSPTVRALLASEIGTRAAEGNIGSVQRWFAGTQYIDEVEALCVELLKQAFRCRYADHRLMGSMLGNMAAYYSLVEPGDVVMTVAQPFGGHSSNRVDGPAGQRGLKIVDIPWDVEEMAVDIELFRKMAPLVRPKLVTLGLSMTLFPQPVREIKAVLDEWGGRLFFDGAHQAGLIAGGQFQDPLLEGADLLTGSAGKTFGGPQSGMILWNDPALTVPITQAIFPVLAATHQVNRVAALAVAAAEMIAFGKEFMAQIVRNSQALAAALDRQGIPVLGKKKGYTTTHQVIADVKAMGGGLDSAHLLARANLITNKNLLPNDTPKDWDRPSGLRMGTIEVTRLGMKEAQMEQIAGFIAQVLVEKRSPDQVLEEVIEFRQPYQDLYYCFDNGLPA